MEKETKKLTWEQFVKRNEGSFRKIALVLEKKARKLATT